MQLDPEILEATFTNEGTDLKTLCEKQPVLLVFLRHFGCTFCREAMADISKIKQDVIDLGLKPVFVHMSTDEIAEGYFEKYNLKGTASISDPDLSLYEYFGLTKGNFGQLYGLKIWLRGLKAAWVDGHGAPKLDKNFGDHNQMPGLFILKNGKMKAQFIHKSAADRPNYLGFITNFLKKESKG
jgi:peroxiredoxin